MRKLLAAGLLAIGSIASSYGFIIEPDTGSTLVISNATYWGTEGDINRKFKGYIGGSTNTHFNYVGKDPRLTITNLVITTNTFGIITNNTWSPGQAATNFYYVAVNFSAAAFPTNTAPITTWDAYWRIAVMPASETPTNYYLWGDGSAAFPNSASVYGAVNHFLLINGDQKIAFEVAPGSLDIDVHQIRVDLDVVGEYE